MITAKSLKQKKSADLRKEIRQVGVLVVDVRDKVSLVAEQYSDIKATLGVHTRKLDSHGEILAKLATDMEIVKENIEFLKHGFKKKVDLEEFAALERRVALLEKRR